MMNSKKLLLSAVSLAAVVALSACGSAGNSASSSPAASSAPAASASASAAPAAGGKTIEVTEEASNFQFSQPEIKAKVGDTIKLTMKNTDGVHGLEIKDLKVNIKNGETAEIKLDKKGTYEFNCSIMCGTGHDGMTGKIVVE